VLAVAGFTVPRLVSPPFQPSVPAASGPSAHKAPGPASTPGPAARTATPLKSSPPPSSPPAGPVAHPPAPGNFAVSSVTFIGTQTGWVIGQAGIPGHCTGPDPDICTSIARTDTAGRSWYGVPAPVTGPPDGSHGVGQIRFLNPLDGWAFGPQLWSTLDGGKHWLRIPTGGLRVTALETRGDRVFAVWARCTGTGVSVSGCSSFSLHSAEVGSDNWVTVPGASGPAALASGPAALVLTGSRGYVLSPGGQLFSGPVDSTSGWGPVRGGGLPVTAACAAGAAQPSGQGPRALLAATGTGLVLLCPGPAVGTLQAKPLYYSADGGASWQRTGSAPRRGAALSLSGTPSGGVVVATSQGIELSHAPGAPWRAARVSAPPGGFGYAGMTTDAQGVAVPADPSAKGVWFTYDGGLDWEKSTVG
jgi:hypothetical protein